MKTLSEYLDTSLDKTFEELRAQKQLSWYPWVGKEYFSADTRVMFILESAYQNESNRETIQTPAFTRQTIYEVFVKGETYSRTLNNLRKFLLELMRDGATSEEHTWGKLAYHNVIQRPLNGTKERPSSEDYINGCRSLKKILSILRPKLCICMGVGLNKSILEGDAFRGEVVRIKTELGKIDGVWLLDRLNLKLSGHTVGMIFTAHPENKRGFAADAWAGYVKRHVSSELQGLIRLR